MASTIHAAHDRGIVSVDAFGDHVATCGYDGAARLWELRDGRLHCTHEVGAISSGPTFSIALSPATDGGVWMHVGSQCRRLRSWHVSPTTGAVQQWFSVEHTGWVRALTQSSAVDDSLPTLYSVGCNRILSWPLSLRAESTPDLEPRACSAEIELYEDPACVRSHDILCLTHGELDGHGRLASGSVDGALRVWRTSGLSCRTELLQRTADHWIGHDGRVAGVSWSTHGLLSCGYDGWVRLWRPSAGDPCNGAANAWQLRAETRLSSARALCVAGGEHARDGASGNVLLCGTSDGEVVLLDTQSPGLQRKGGLSLGDRRATAIARVRPPAHLHAQRRETFVVGDSQGDLHIVSASA